MKRLLIVGALVVGALGTTVTQAGAMENFCDWDPATVVITPGGHIATVYVSVWTSHLLDLGLPIATSTTRRAYDAEGNPVTNVDTSIWVPGSLLFGNFQTLDMATTGPLGSGSRLAATYSSAGRITHLHYTLTES